MTIVPSPTNNLLRLFGLALTTDGEAVITDLRKAERCGIHHTFEPIAALGWSAASASFARGRLPKYELGDVFSKRPNFDERTAVAFAALCGAAVTGPFYNRPERFDTCLRSFLTRHRLGGYFQDFGDDDYHRAIHPTDYDVNETDRPVELNRWRRGYLKEPRVRQMLIASVLWLYLGEGEKDSIWLADLPCAWHIADAYLELSRAGVLAEWGELVARYPGFW